MSLENQDQEKLVKDYAVLWELFECFIGDVGSLLFPLRDAPPTDNTLYVIQFLGDINKRIAEAKEDLEDMSLKDFAINETKEILITFPAKEVATAWSGFKAQEEDNIFEGKQEELINDLLQRVKEIESYIGKDASKQDYNEFIEHEEI